jgi:hypothetical protein
MTDDQSIDAALSHAEDAATNGRSLRGTGFWPAVEKVKRDPALVERYADRIAPIDRRAFENGVKLRVPAWAGLAALTALSAFGVWALVVAHRACRTCLQLPSIARLSGRGPYEVERALGMYGWRGFVPIAFLVGFGAILVGTHCLAHLIVGRLVGIRFTHVFLGGPPPPRPGLKTDYATYLRASPRARALMHASGAVLTKLVPFALLPFSLTLYDGWPWLTCILLFVGAVQIVTDVFLSTKVSDWKKVKRELRAARG